VPRGRDWRARSTSVADPFHRSGRADGSAGGEFMVDVRKSFNFEYVAAYPGSSFRGSHESLLNYNGNKTPEFTSRNCLVISDR
jgi:hypothetical protein